MLYETSKQIRFIIRLLTKEKHLNGTEEKNTTLMLPLPSTLQPNLVVRFDRGEITLCLIRGVLRAIYKLKKISSFFKYVVQ